MFYLIGQVIECRVAVNLVGRGLIETFCIIGIAGVNLLALILVVTYVIPLLPYGQ